MRIFKCGYCGFIAPESLFEWGKGKEYGQHPEHRYCPRCLQSIDWHGYGIFWEEEEKVNARK